MHHEKHYAEATHTPYIHALLHTTYTTIYLQSIFPSRSIAVLTHHLTPHNVKGRVLHPLASSGKKAIYALQKSHMQSKRYRRIAMKHCSSRYPVLILNNRYHSPTTCFYACPCTWVRSTPATGARARGKHLWECRCSLMLRQNRCAVDGTRSGNKVLDERYSVDIMKCLQKREKKRVPLYFLPSLCSATTVFNFLLKTQPTAH